MNLRVFGWKPAQISNLCHFVLSCLGSNLMAIKCLPLCMAQGPGWACWPYGRWCKRQGWDYLGFLFWMILLPGSCFKNHACNAQSNLQLLWATQCHKPTIWGDGLYHPFIVIFGDGLLLALPHWMDLIKWRWCRSHGLTRFTRCFCSHNWKLRAPKSLDGLGSSKLLLHRGSWIHHPQKLPAICGHPVIHSQKRIVDRW